MSNKKKTESPIEVLDRFHTNTISAFGFELIRSILVPDLLGKENGGILYWAGKDLARKYPLNSTEEIIAFFQKASWGTLELAHETKKEMIFHLSSSLLNKRYQLYDSVTYQLEAGFLAEQMQNITNYITETYTTDKRGNDYTVIFKVQWDLKDEINKVLSNN